VAVSDRAGVLVVPLAPAPDGNGLAMRAGLLLEAMAAAGPVDVVVVPVSGPAAPTEWAAARARRIVVLEPSVGPAPDVVLAQLGDVELRDLLTRTAPLPARARAAPPTLAARVAGAADVVVVLRSYLAPLGITLARRLGARRVVVDLDDDDERLLRELGDEEEADAHGRLARAWLPAADVVVAASPSEADSVATRYGLGTVAVLPNAVRPPTRVTAPPGDARLLFVGNLTYQPNVDAARELVEQVLPGVRVRVPEATVALVGPHDDRLAPLVAHDGVHVAGPVPDVTPWYATSDVVVVPLRAGAGTRIKVLEAFAHQRPVVGTPAAFAGLAVREGTSVLVGDDATTLTAHVVTLLRDPTRARALVAEASVVVREHYLLDVVAADARRLVFGEG